MNTFDPQVECIAVMDERQKAWNISRPNLKPDDLDFLEIKDADLSLNSMCIYTLRIRSSTLFRDLILSLRPIQCWARSLRAINMSHETIRLSSEFAWDENAQDSVNEMIRLDGLNAPRDSIRGMAPMSLSTEYVITIDHRLVMAFCMSLHMLNPELFKLYGNLILDAIPDGQIDLTTSSVNPVHLFVGINDDERINGTVKTGGVIFGHYQMKCALASQFLRQHYSKIKIGYWDMIEDYFTTSMIQEDSVDVAYYIDKAAYHQLMRMRSHWVADWSKFMWGSMISDYIKDMNVNEFWDFLPNGGGRKDKYVADMQARVSREDPNLPCPIMCEWEDLIYRRECEIGESEITRKYHELFDAGIVLDNPSNKYRVKYLKGEMQ